MGDGPVGENDSPDGRGPRGEDPSPAPSHSDNRPRTRALVRAPRDAPVSFETDALRRRTCALTRKTIAVR